ncbi:hypothetical protein DSM110093_03794 (plasmid) [Sulfitobacter sp. DSM 110093]|nr:hypothetical protein DSM110093_03533 [Sulfitobacter sp. DSM 110093]UOA33959.1 hypothetical protein DSM110093_03794 [Sulfitobacter sp. DSM 110093]
MERDAASVSWARSIVLAETSTSAQLQTLPFDKLALNSPGSNKAVACITREKVGFWEVTIAGWVRTYHKPIHQKGRRCPSEYPMA